MFVRSGTETPVNFIWQIARMLADSELEHVWLHAGVTALLNDVPVEKLDIQDC